MRFFSCFQTQIPTIDPLLFLLLDQLHGSLLHRKSPTHPSEVSGWSELDASHVRTKDDISLKGDIESPDKSTEQEEGMTQYVVWEMTYVRHGATYVGVTGIILAIHPGVSRPIQLINSLRQYRMWRCTNCLVSLPTQSSTKEKGHTISNLFRPDEICLYPLDTPSYRWTSSYRF